MIKQIIVSLIIVIFHIYFLQPAGSQEIEGKKNEQKISRPLTIEKGNFEVNLNYQYQRTDKEFDKNGHSMDKEIGTRFFWNNLYRIYDCVSTPNKIPYIDFT